MRKWSNVWFLSWVFTSSKKLPSAPQPCLPRRAPSREETRSEGATTTGLRVGLAAACQLKHEGRVEMKELFTRAPWERDLKEIPGCCERRDGGCRLCPGGLRHHQVRGRGVAAAMAGGSAGTMPTPAGVWVPPRRQRHEVSGRKGWMGCSGAPLCTASAFPLPCSRQEGWPPAIAADSVRPSPAWELSAGLVLTPGDMEGTSPPGGEGEGRRG